MSASWPSAQTSAHPELSEAWGAINDLQTSKLWHQLGEKLTTLIADPYFTKHPSLLTDLFTNVVKPAVRQLSPIVVANIAIAAARSQTDAAEGISFLKSVSADVSKNASASVLLLSSIASLQAASGKIHGAVATIDSASGVVSGNIGPVAAEASAALHQASAELARARGNAAGFFEHSLLSLTYRDVDAIPDDEKTALATEIAAAAIVGDGVYSFGELISHPLMASLESAPAGDAALGAILRALDAGDLDALAKLRAEHGSAGKGAAGRVFSENAAVIDDKARVSALGVRVFELSAAARTVPIATVAKWVGVSEDEADAVVIRAVALGVVRAEIDGVEQTVRFTWTMPRVLSQVQLEALRDRVGEWRKTAEVAVQFVTDNTKELLP